LAAFAILPLRALLYTLVEQPSSLLFIQILDGLAAGILGVMGTVINSYLATNTGRFNFLKKNLRSLPNNPVKHLAILSLNLSLLWLNLPEMLME
jgi:hypothetical protein